MIKKFNDPWEHYLVDNFLPIEILKSLKNIKIESKNNLCDGTRTPIQEDIFLHLIKRQTYKRHSQFLQRKNR